MRLNFLFQMLTCGAIGAVLFTAGIDFSNWQYWVTLLLLIVYGYLCGNAGYKSRRR